MSRARPSASSLVRLVTETVEALDAIHFPLTLPGVEQLEETRESLMTQLSGRLIPQLEKKVVPAVVVVGGSSGAGKSTLVNTLVGETVTEAGVLRPTTRVPMLVLHPDDERSMHTHALTEMCEVVESDGAIRGLAMIDAPDLDSVDDSNRRLSRMLTSAADLWVFVTSAARYGDHVAWNALVEAYDRGMTTAVVLDRVPERARLAVRADLTKRMAESGMGDSPLFLIPDAGPTDGLLEPELVAELRQWLELISTRHAASALAGRTARATMPALRSELLGLSDAADMQASVATDLRDGARAATQPVREKLRQALKSGRLGLGAPTTQWLSLASTGGALAPLVSGKFGMFGGRSKAKRDTAALLVADAAEDALEMTLTQSLISARDAIATQWGYSPADTGAMVREVVAGLDIDALVTETIAEWTRSIDSVAEKSASSGISSRGIAALARAGAIGVAGAESACAKAGAPNAVGLAKSRLISSCDGAVDAVCQAFEKAIDAIDLPDPSRLRLRAGELVRLMWEDA